MKSHYNVANWVRAMVFNTTINNIAVTSQCSKYMYVVFFSIVFNTFLLKDG